MKKIKILTSLAAVIGLTGTVLTISSCGCATSNEVLVPTEAFKIVGETLKGFKDGVDISNCTKMIIPSNVLIIEENAFSGALAGNNKITTVVIPGNVKQIKTNAFANCKNVAVFDFSSFTIDDVFRFEPSEQLFGDLSSYDWYANIKTNNEWSDIVKNHLINKLIKAGVPNYWMVPQTTGHVEVTNAMEQTKVDGGNATHDISFQGQYGENFEYEAATSRIDGTKDVSIKSNAETVVAENYKTMKVDTQMVPLTTSLVSNEQHVLADGDWVSYNLTIFCHNKNSTEIKWVQTLGPFKLTYHNVLSNVEIISQPAKSNYKAGETFDKTGLKIKATYSNDQTEEITADNPNLATSLDGHVFTVDDVKNPPTGIVKFKHEDKEVQSSNVITINMISTLLSIEVVSLPTKSTYFPTQSFSAEGLSIKPIYDDGVERDPILWDGINLKTSYDEHVAFTTDDIHEHTITATYKDSLNQEATTTFNIAVSNFTGIKLKTLPKILYYDSNTLNVSNAKIVGLNSDEEVTDPIQVTPEMCYLDNSQTPCTSATIIRGLHKLTIKHFGFETSLYIDGKFDNHAFYEVELTKDSKPGWTEAVYGKNTMVSKLFDDAEEGKGIMKFNIKLQGDPVSWFGEFNSWKSNPPPTGLNSDFALYTYWTDDKTNPTVIKPGTATINNNIVTLNGFDQTTGYVTLVLTRNKGSLDSGKTFVYIAA